MTTTRSFVLLLLLMLLVAPLPNAQSQGQVQGPGEPLTKKEQLQLERLLGKWELGAFPRVIAKRDIDGNGHEDFVVILPGVMALIYLQFPERAAHYEQYEAVAPDKSSESQLVQIDFLPTRHDNFTDIVVRGAKECGILLFEPVSNKSGRHSLRFGRFPCEWSNRTYFLKQAECHAHHGEWKIMGLRQFIHCTRPTRDGGQQCTSSTECENRCLYVGPTAKIGSPATGQCAASNQGFGCFHLVHDGKYAGRLCAD